MMSPCEITSLTERSLNLNGSFLPVIKHQATKDGVALAMSQKYPAVADPEFPRGGAKTA